MYEDDKFSYVIPREDFNGTDDEYFALMPGHFMDNWMNEYSTKTLVRLSDEFNTPDSALPQYIVSMMDEFLWFHMLIKSDSLYKFWVERYALKYYDRVDEYIIWDRSKFKEGGVDYPYQKDVFKLKPEFEHRMIKKGYKDAATKSMGKYFDIERSVNGVPGPLTKKLHKLFKK